ncbi:MAG: hypothetical protein NZ534_08280, partial [Bacteroidia bacterium]|nr:hypothetical protein [Bacteroidia bacterium]
TPGVYTVELIAENSFSGLSDTFRLENHITVHQTPDLPLNIAGPTTVCAGDTVVLFTYRRPGFTYQWYLDDTPLPEATDTIFYAQTSGDYTLRIFNPANPLGPCVRIHGPVSVVVFPQPETGDIVADGGPNLCPGMVVTAAVTFDPDVDYQWYRNGQPIQGTNTHQIVVDAGGEYWVEAFNAGGCRDSSDTLTFFFASAPDADVVQLSGSTTLCHGDTLVISAPFLEELNYIWFKDGQSFAAPGVNFVRVVESGEYRLILENSQGCRDTSETVEVVFYPPVGAGILATNGFLLCEGDSTRLYFDAQPNTTFAWTRNGEPWGEGQASFWVYESATFALVVRDTLTGCRDTFETVVEFSPYPSAPQIIFEGLNPFCPDQTLRLLVNPSPGLTYQWYRDDAALDGQNQPSLEIQESGFYSVAAVNAAGCATFSLPFEAVRFAEPPLPPLVGPTIGCEGQTLRLYFHPLAGQTYLWYRDGQAVSSDTFVVVAQNGAYRYSAIDVATGCRSESEIFPVVFEPRPSPPVLATEGPSSVCPGQSTTLIRIADYAPTDLQYLWYWNDAPLPDEMLDDLDGPQLTVRQPGVYRVEAVYPETGCASASDSVVIGTGVPIANDTIYRDAETPDSVCAGDTVRLFVLASEGTTCRWFRNEQLLTEGPVYQWHATVSGQYRVEFVSGGCVAQSDPFSVYIRLSDVHLSGFPDTVIIGRTYFNTVYVVPYDSSWEYQWYFNGVVVPGANQPRLTSLQDGLISVRIRDPSG